MASDNSKVIVDLSDIEDLDDPGDFLRAVELFISNLPNVSRSEADTEDFEVNFQLDNDEMYTLSLEQ